MHFTFYEVNGLLKLNKTNIDLKNQIIIIFYFLVTHPYPYMLGFFPLPIKL